MSKIRIDTEQVRAAGRRLLSESNRMEQMGHELRRAIGSLDTWAWDGRSRSRAEPMLNRVQPESTRLADEIEFLGQKLQYVADVFEQEDQAATRGFDEMPWGVFDAKGTGEGPQSSEEESGGSRIANSMSRAIADASKFLVPGFAAATTQWLPKRLDVEFSDLWTSQQKSNKKTQLEKLHLAIFKGKVWGTESTGDTRLGGVRLGGRAEANVLEGEAGIGANLEEGLVGGYIGGTFFTAGASGIIGDTDFGVGAGTEVKVGEAEALLGLKDGRFGAKIGGSLVSAEGTVGMNVAGWNVGLSGEVGVKFELGIEVGEESKVHLGPFSLGLNIGEALGS